MSAQDECPTHQDPGTAGHVMDSQTEDSSVKDEHSECCDGAECMCPCAQASLFAPPTVAPMSTDTVHFSQHAIPRARQRLTALFRPPA
jgi:hypothetical protein